MLKFKYVDEVKVSDGFFKGLIGRVIDIDEKSYYDITTASFLDKYLFISHDIQEYIREDYLEKI